MYRLLSDKVYFYAEVVRWFKSKVAHVQNTYSSKLLSACLPVDIATSEEGKKSFFASLAAVGDLQPPLSDSDTGPLNVSHLLQEVIPILDMSDIAVSSFSSQFHIHSSNIGVLLR